jgi:hypothetical protein
MTDHDPIAVGYSTLDGLKKHALDLGIALDNAHHPLGDSYDRVLGGAGQFADHLQGEATEYLLAWKAALDIMSDGASVIGNSIGKSAIDLAAADAAHGGEIIL